MTGTDKVLLARDDGSGGDVEAGTVRDNEEDEVRYEDMPTVFYRILPINQLSLRYYNNCNR